MNILEDKKIYDGEKYDHLVVHSSCERYDIGSGNDNAEEGMRLMLDWVDDYSYHVRKLAKKLKKSNLYSTVRSIHDFYTKHFNYDPDDRLQKLRSPGCAWQQRKYGIDCKSATIFIASLLKEMGILSYMRQIKQPGIYEDLYTHVYNIVPKDQVNADLSKGYIVIDGTVSDNKEVNFLHKNDMPVQIMGMNGTCTPKQAKQVVKASNAGRRLQKGKTTGGRDLAKWRHRGMLGADKNIRNSLKGYGFDNATINAMLDDIEELVHLNGQNSINITGHEGGVLIYANDNVDDGQVYFPSVSKKSGKKLTPEDPEFWYGDDHDDDNNDDDDAESGDSGSSSDDGSFFGDLLSNVDISNIANILTGGIFNISGGFYGQDDVESNFQNILELLQDFQDNFNQAVEMNPVSIAQWVHELRYRLDFISKMFEFKKSLGYSNNTEQKLQYSSDVTADIGNTVQELIDAYVGQYLQPDYTKPSFTKNFQDDNYPKPKWSALWGDIAERTSASYPPTNGFQRNNSLDIPAFEIREDIITNAMEGNDINAQTWLNSLTNIIVDAVSNDDNGGGSGSNDGNGDGDGNSDNNGGGNDNGGDQTAPFIGGLNKSTVTLGGIGIAVGLLFQDQIKNLFK